MTVEELEVKTVGLYTANVIYVPTLTVADPHRKAMW